MMDREARLPKWARVELDRLRALLGEAQKTIAAAESNAPSNTRLDHYERDAHNLGDGVRIRFGPVGERDHWIDCRWSATQRALEVVASKSLAVSPSSSNVCYLQLGGFYA